MIDLTTALRVLIVDDEPFQLKLLSRQLGKLGVEQITSRQHAGEALDMLRADPSAFDLVCCDLQMPGMDGVEFIRHLGSVGYGGGLVLISGEDSRIVQTAERLARAHAIQVLGALQKPVSPEQLATVLVSARGLPAPAVAARQHQYAVEEIRRALVNHELVNHYQPKVDLRSGQVIGVETLVRWSHPIDGLIFPDQFIAAVEDHGLIDNLTRAVLTGLSGALQQARRWQDQGFPLQVAVNVSMDNLTDHAFPGFVAEEVAAAGIPPSRLTLEVTESRLMTDPVVTLDILTRLRLKRVGLSIDDFGTGHSSLSQLRDIPFDELKIDRGFVHDAGSHESLGAIVRASLEMARQLGMKTVAEGVENIGDWHFLRDAGCDLAQGYFIGRPMPAEAVIPWIAEWESRRGELLL
jgi:EAL domain-containing protein (putative c-di-GMP-specific phosphodiesterase class I)